MIKKNKSMMVIGSTIVAVISILLVYVLLISTGVIVGREYTIIFEAVNVEKVYDGTPLNAEGYRISVGQDIIDAHKLEPRVTIQYSDGYNGVDVDRKSTRLNSSHD